MMALSPLSLRLIRLFGRQGYRVVGLTGVFLLAISCLSSSFVNSAQLLFLTFGAIFGIGACFLYMASSLVIADHFPVGHPHHVKATITTQGGFPIGE